MTLPRLPTRLRPLLTSRDPARWSLVAVIAVTAFLAALAGIGLIALHDARRAWGDALGGALTLQLPADTSQARLEVVLALLRQAEGVTGAQVIDSVQAARLLEPWLGKSAPVDLLPLPRLIDIRIDHAGAADLEGLQQRLKSVVPEAQLEDHRLWLARLLAASSRLQGVGAAIVAVAAVVAGLSALVVVANSFERNRERIALLHALGAEDRDIAGPFVMPAAAFGLISGAIGAAAAIGAWAVLAGIANDLEFPSFAPAVTDRAVLLELAGTVLASGIIAAGAAVLSARRALLRLP